jgi:diguanylate cyclase (GGDEF)-like protein/PAS domain S-box-containing protein
MLDHLATQAYLRTSLHRRVRRRRWLGVTTAILLCALLSLIVGTIILAHQVEAARESIEERVEANSRIRQLQAILLLIGDAETGQRGYLLTGKRRYLGSYEHAVTDLPRMLDTIREANAQGPTLKADLQKVRGLVLLKLNELAETIRLHDTGQQSAALNLIQTDAGQRYMEEVRNSLAGAMDELRARRDAAELRVLNGSTAIKRWALLTVSALAACIGLAALQLRSLAASRRRNEMALATQTAILNVVIDEIPSMVAVWDRDLKYRLINKSFERWREKTRRNVIGRTVEEVAGGHEYQQSLPWLQRALAGETVTYEKDYPHAMIKHVAVTYSPLVLDGGEVGGVIAIGHDITKLHEERSHLKDRSERDPLTGLLNRAGFEALLARQVTDGAGANLALLYIDLDEFKPVNDRYGHGAGDQVLRIFAHRAQSVVRPTDAVARLGGDEFAISLAGLHSHEAAQRVAENLIAATRKPFDVGGHMISIGVSVGVAFDADGDEGWPGLVTRADAMVYRAKQSGRGRASIEGQA